MGKNFKDYTVLTSKVYPLVCSDFRYLTKYGDSAVGKNVICCLIDEYLGIQDCFGNSLILTGNKAGGSRIFHVKNAGPLENMNSLMVKPAYNAYSQECSSRYNSGGPFLRGFKTLDNQEAFKGGRGLYYWRYTNLGGRDECAI